MAKRRKSDSNRSSGGSGSEGEEKPVEKADEPDAPEKMDTTDTTASNVLEPSEENTEMAAESSPVPEQKVQQLESTSVTTPVQVSEVADTRFATAAQDLGMILTGTKRRGMYHCDYCHTDISQLPRIRCAVCPDFDLCLECFSTTDHSSAVALIKAAADTHSALKE